MADSDDDAPPPLDSLPQQVAALRVGGDPTPATAGPSVAEVTISGGPSSKATKKDGGVKKGFFDAKPKPRKKKPAPKPTSEVDKVEEIPMLKGSGNRINTGGASIPDFMYVDKDEEEKKYAEAKSKMLEALKPNEDDAKAALNNPALAAGFDDPEVLAAVDEVAKDPSAIRKYQNNPKVMGFYRAMAGMVGERFEAMGEADPRKQMGR